MKPLPMRRKISPNEGGYALLLMVFLTALLVVSSLYVGLRLTTEAKRQKEEEMIWRGKQYVRGIKLYYKKTGRYPTTLDDLTKGSGVGNIHYMRQAYKDPMNKEDGSWRFLYVGPNGQLIGSLKPPPTNSLLPQSGGLGTPAAALGGAGGLLPSQQPGSATPQNPSGGPTGTTPGATPGSSDGTNSGTGAADSSSNPQPITPTETPTIIGGNIIGVGSKINEKSIIVYEKAKNYRLFEFYWDPSKDLQAAAQGAGLQLGTGLQNGQGQQPATNPFAPQGTPPPGGPAPTTGAPPNPPAPPQQP
jgi:hypothetical protein